MTSTKLSECLKNGRTFWMAGAYDALSARLIELAGFDGVFTTGFGISASYLGQPDMELLTLTENAGVVRRVVDAVNIPVFADADTGYGNSLNVRRTVKEMENAGAQGLVLEDQESPKRCPAVASAVSLASVAESVSRLKAALDTRRSEHFLIIARTDATDPSEALDRAALYAELGADLVQPISRTFRSLQDLRKFKQNSNKPVSLQLIDGTWLADLSKEEVQSIAQFATYPLAPITAVSHALQENLSALLNEGIATCAHPRTSLTNFKKIVRFDELHELQTRYEN